MGKGASKKKLSWKPLETRIVFVVQVKSQTTKGWEVAVYNDIGLAVFPTLRTARHMQENWQDIIGNDNIFKIRYRVRRMEMKDTGSV